MLLRRHLLQGLSMYIFWWNVWNQNYSTVFCPFRIMYCITYYLLWRTLVTTCDNDLTLLLSRQKTATWSGRISCIGWYSRIFIRRLYVIVFSLSFYCICCHFLSHIVLYACCYGLRLSYLIFKNYLLSYLRSGLLIVLCCVVLCCVVLCCIVLYIIFLTWPK